MKQLFIVKKFFSSTRPNGRRIILQKHGLKSQRTDPFGANASHTRTLECVVDFACDSLRARLQSLRKQLVEVLEMFNITD